MLPRMVTPALLHAVMPRAPIDWILSLLDELPRWGIDNDNEIASFVAQVAYESREFTRLEEDLRYTAERLVQVWHKHFPTLAAAQPYAGHPVRLANFVYAGRMGNGPPESGDGWRFHGRGPLQITGRANYQACAAAIHEPLIERPELLLLPAIGIKSACWYWRSRDLNRVDDDDSALAETRAINGGTHGLASRQAYLDKLITAFTRGAA